MNATAKVKQGALIESTHAEAHLVDGRFDVERMMPLLNEAVESALNDGFAGLRTWGDMSWLIQKPAGAESVVEYEALLNQFFEGIRGAGMCQYDRRRLPLHFVDHGLATHTSAVVDGVHVRNPFFRPASIATTLALQPADVDWKISELRRAPR